MTDVKRGPYGPQGIGLLMQAPGAFTTMPPQPNSGSEEERWPEIFT